MDATLRGLERAWVQTRDPQVGARLLHAQRLPLAEALRHPLLADVAVRQRWAESLADAPLADLVRAQVALLDDELDVETRSRLTQRAAELLDDAAELLGARARRWAGRRVSFEDLAGTPGRWELRAGRLVRFPTRVRAQALVEQGAQAWGGGAAPPLVIDGLYQADAVHAFRLQFLRQQYGPHEWAGPLAGCAALAAVRALTLDSAALGDGATRELLGSPHLNGLASLELAVLQQSAEGLAPLFDSPRFASLRRLSFARLDDQDGSCELGDEAAQRLAGAAHLAGLERLTLPFASVGADGLLALVGGGLPGLRALTLTECPVGAEGAERLAREPKLARLRELDLSLCELGAGLAALLASPHLSDLEALAVGWPGERDVPELCVPETWPAGLRELDLSGWRVTPDDVDRLGRAHLPALRSLRLSSCRLGDDALAALAAAPLLTGVERLDLTQNAFGDAGLAALFASPRLGALRELRLGSLYASPFSPAGLAAIAHASLPCLNQLDLSDAWGLWLVPLAEALLTSPSLPRLTWIELPEPGEALDRLQARWGPRACAAAERGLDQQLAEVDG